ncbi:unnamed protein product [Linum trigynum]|uniref:Uncharacterized protein n=1 Tax=Linum trigynum TaxID=586398 RepID=A0AAV2F0F9_9ROSI
MEAGNRRRGRREVPAWEKRFCLVVGRMPWRDFLRRKKYVACWGSKCIDRVMAWDDSAGYECFRDAKARFCAKNYSDCGTLRELKPRALLGPDVYVDDVVWRGPNDDGDRELRRLVAEAEEAQERARESAAARNDCVVYSKTIPLEEIKATGWDDDSWRNPGLTGMLVGGDDVGGSGGKGRCRERKTNWCNGKKMAER